MNIFVILSILTVSKINMGGCSIFNETNLQDSEFINLCSAAGQPVCMNCVTVGECQQQGSGFTVVPKETCGSGEFCDPAVPGPAMCYRLNPATTECGCNGLPCNVDPNDSLSFFTCSEMGINETKTCKIGEKVDLALCECKSIECPSCGGYPNSLTNCSQYIYCGGAFPSQAYCPGGLCFDAYSCGCVEPCPPCGYKPNPSNSSLYYYCSGGTDVPGFCAKGLTFNSASCLCESIATTTTALITTTTTAAPCPPCGFTAFPGDPNKYIYCKDGDQVIISCQLGTTFDTTTCCCESLLTTTTSSATTTTTSSATTTTASTTTTPPPCPSCGYKPFPGDDTKYIYCKDGAQVIISCQPGAKFDSTTCYCEPVPTTTTARTTTTAPPCPSCGYKPFPGDNTKYINCSTGAIGSCPNGFVYSPSLCYCI